MSLVLLEAPVLEKSTMLRCINFLETPNSGTINVCGDVIDCNQVNLNAPDKKSPRKKL